jgi:hypothetical protein
MNQRSSKYQIIEPVNFDEITAVYTPTSSPQIKPMPGCMGYMATNIGDGIVHVNDKILYPGVVGTNVGESVIIGGYYGYEFKGMIRLVFDQPVGAQPQIELTQLFVPKEQNT